MIWALWAQLAMGGEAVVDVGMVLSENVILTWEGDPALGSPMSLVFDFGVQAYGIPQAVPTAGHVYVNEDLGYTFAAAFTRVRCQDTTDTPVVGSVKQISAGGYSSDLFPFAAGQRATAGTTDDRRAVYEGLGTISGVHDLQSGPYGSITWDGSNDGQWFWLDMGFAFSSSAPGGAVNQTIVFEVVPL